MSHIEKEKLIKADIASIENRVRHAFNQGYDLGYKEGKERAKPLEQEPFDNRPCISSGVCEHDKQKVLDEIRAEIEEIELLARYTRGDIKRMAIDVIDKHKAESEV